MYIILFLLVLISIMIYKIYFKIYCKKNIEKFIDNDEYWKNYRLGDIYKCWTDLKWDKYKHEYYKSIPKEYPNSIGAVYVLQNKPMKENNFNLLLKIIDEKSKNMELPKENELVIHLRIGDVIKDFNNGKFIYHYNKLRNTCYATKIESLEKNIDKFKGKNIVIFYGNHRKHINKKANELYLQHIRDLFKKHDISYVEKKSGNPDDDFVYMCNSKYFGQSGGGYSQLIANYVKHKGNTVFEFNKI